MNSPETLRKYMPTRVGIKYEPIPKFGVEYEEVSSDKATEVRTESPVLDSVNDEVQVQPSTNQKRTKLLVVEFPELQTEPLTKASGAEIDVLLKSLVEKVYRTQQDVVNPSTIAQEQVQRLMKMLIEHQRLFLADEETGGASSDTESGISGRTEPKKSTDMIVDTSSQRTAEHRLITSSDGLSNSVLTKAASSIGAATFEADPSLLSNANNIATQNDDDKLSRHSLQSSASRITSDSRSTSASNGASSRAARDISMEENKSSITPTAAPHLSPATTIALSGSESSISPSRDVRTKEEAEAGLLSEEAAEEEEDISYAEESFEALNSPQKVDSPSMAAPESDKQASSLVPTQTLDMHNSSDLEQSADLSVAEDDENLDEEVISDGGDTGEASDDSGF